MASVKRVKVDGTLDRQIITAMVVSTPFLREVRDIYSEEFLAADYQRLVARWCIEHYAEYNKAPGKNIQTIYETAVERKDPALRDESARDLVAQFLSGLSNEYDAKSSGEGSINVPYLLDEAERRFRTRDLEHLKREIEDALDRADPEQAEELLRKHSRVERAQAGGFEPFKDKDRQRALFDIPMTPLVTFRGAFGELWNPMATRDQLIMVQAPEKAGKTFLLAAIAGQSVMAQNNTAFFEAGDLSESQIMRRWFCQMANVPGDARFLPKDKTLRVSSLDCVRNQLGLCALDGKVGESILRSSMLEMVPDILPEGYAPCAKCRRKQSDDFIPCVGWRDKVFDKVLTEDDCDRVSKKALAHLGSKQMRFRIDANDTLSVADIHDQLLRWRDTNGFIPDVIIIDYADILAWEDGAKDERQAQNMRWKRLRKLSQEWHALVVVATQSNVKAHMQQSQNIGNFSEDKRKYAHCTGVLAVHRTLQERDAGVLRLSWLLGRELPSVEREVVVVSSLATGRLHVDSFWREQSRLGKEYRYDPRGVMGKLILEDGKEEED
jgi:DNA-binding GntR family transcriptional regulator